MTHWKDRFTVVPAVYVIFERDGKVLLMRRANTDYMNGFYGLPSGHLEGGETAAVAAAREAAEEVGLHVDPDSDLELVHTLHRRTNADEEHHERLDLFFRAKSFTGEAQNLEPDKCDDVRWVSYDALPDSIIPEVELVLEAVRQRRIYSEYNFG